MTHTNDNFIMLPTVDICFKNLMENERVRQGFIAALLNVRPEEVRKTTTIPTILKQDYADEKLGILDVKVLLEDGTQIDIEMQVTYFAYWDARILFYLTKMFSGQIKRGEPYEKLKKCIHVSILDFNWFKDSECWRRVFLCDGTTLKKYSDLLEIQILELGKLPPEDRNEAGIIRWMRFLGGKNREELEDMAKTDEYLGEAYEELEKMSADEMARLEYEAREKAIRDYNSLMERAEKMGLQQGVERGIKQGADLKLRELVLKKVKKGYSEEEIADILETDVEAVRGIIEEEGK